jgi:hypothetical protein
MRAQREAGRKENIGMICGRSALAWTALVGSRPRSMLPREVSLAL